MNAQRTTDANNEKTNNDGVKNNEKEKRGILWDAF